MTRPSSGLSGNDLTDWITLRRVHSGGIARHGDDYLEHGHSLPGFVLAALIDLVRSRLIQVAPQPDAFGVRHLTLTDQGIARFGELDRRHAVN